MAMLIDRNQTSHAYNEEIAEEIFCKVLGQYYDVFLALKKIGFIANCP
jgi:hypothetical protein